MGIPSADVLTIVQFRFTIQAYQGVTKEYSAHPPQPGHPNFKDPVHLVVSFPEDSCCSGPNLLF
jgi:hypothetical protein